MCGSYYQFSDWPLCPQGGHITRNYVSTIDVDALEPHVDISSAGMVMLVKDEKGFISVNATEIAAARIIPDLRNYRKC